VRFKSNDEKIEKYKEFWNREAVHRPIIGFDVGGYFPFQRFKAFRRFKKGDILVPDMIRAKDYLRDYESFYEESVQVQDDLIKGVAPIPAIPWMELMIGCSAEIAEDSIWAKERRLQPEDIIGLSIADNNVWLNKYLKFLYELVQSSKGRYPVSQPILRGISDLHGVLRGHSDALIDCLEAPEMLMEGAKFIMDASLKVFEKQYDVIEPYLGGYYIEQYMLWAPDRIIRIQEDASGNFSPDIYRELFQKFDRAIASSFPYTLIHLHNSSLFLIDLFLEIEEIDVFQINLDSTGMTVEEEIPYLKKIQNKGRCLLLRGAYTLDDLTLIRNKLSTEGLFIQIICENKSQAEKLIPHINNIW
jgi:hypothetical protein